MRVLTLTFVLINAFLGIQAQNYMIDFAGAGASNSVDSVKIENLSQCTSLTIGGSDVLNLNPTVGMNESFAGQNRVSVFPNPAAGYCWVACDVSSDENVCIGLYDMMGRLLVQQSAFLPEGHHVFRMSGLPNGLCGLKIESGSYRYAAKMISSATTTTDPAIVRVVSTTPLDHKSEMSGAGGMKKIGAAKSIIGMQFNAGDTLKLTGRSGNYRTVYMLFPTQDQTVTFTFVKCTDADSNHYAVVQIGTQLWMQENLKATHYRDGSAIPNIADSATWGSLSSGAYCNFHNDTAEGEYYGRLYNFYAVSDSRNIAPVGWHVASNAEWNVMEKYLDPTVDTAATTWMGRGTVIGRILKEGCNTRWAYLSSTSGLNSAGFTGLCTNFRNNTGAWSLAPNNDHDDSFWTSTSYSATTAWGTSLRWCYGDIYVIPLLNKRAGQSVRCIKD